ncbi:HNH endonuclease [Aeromonas hydrophila]|uniref:HNH endonuclease n=1 Tax=Aeromonas hydrophila TaxID=644 RepID=UPI00227C9FF4|nr:HNH endonuclease [Aeromonas hydrophila]WAG17429.1 HNH endonuclease [Aeromonas hydrophila]
MSIVQSVASTLSEEDKTIFTSKEIKDLAFKKHKIKPTSIIPSDYCYNRTNYGIDKLGILKNKFLSINPDGTYLYLGFNYPFNGYVYHKPKGSKIEMTVGHWSNGNYFPIDPYQNDIEELSNNSFIEGATKTISVNAYERNPNARSICIEHHGNKCWTCGFDFEKKYGDLGKGFIHVHHITPLSQIGHSYKLDPVSDLLPLCPNCHAMVHRKTPAMHPQELKLLIIEEQNIKSI